MMMRFGGLGVLAMNQLQIGQSPHSALCSLYVVQMKLEICEMFENA